MFGIDSPSTTPQTWKLAQSGGNRTQHALDAMSGHAADSGSGEVEAGNQGLERYSQPETNENQLEVHPSESQKDVPVRQARQAARDRLTGRQNTDKQGLRLPAWGSTPADSPNAVKCPLGINS